MALLSLLERHHAEIRTRWQSDARRKLGEIATLPAAQALVDSVVQALRTTDGNAAHPETQVTAEIDPTDVVRSCGILHDVLLTVAAEHSEALSTQELRRIGRATTAATVHAIGESVRARVATVERRSLDDLLTLAHDLRNQLMVVESAVGTGRLERVAERLADLREQVEHDLEMTRLRRVGRMQHRSEALAEILSSAIAQARESNSETSVFVDMLAPISIDGDAALLSWSLSKLVRIAGGSDPRPVLHVTARIVCDGLVRIDLHPEASATAAASANAAADLRLIDEVVRAHLGTLRVTGRDFTVELPGRGQEDACCLGENEKGLEEETADEQPASGAQPPNGPRAQLRERAHAVSREVQRMIDRGMLQEAPPGLQREVLGAVASLATLDGLNGDSLRRAEIALLRLHLRLELLGPARPPAPTGAPN
ncbi:MAG: hypothetical protein JWN44_2037 [Myxococcales bacterium]|nr:hypothetical protein [Myxococcales bacterium]